MVIWISAPAAGHSLARMDTPELLILRVTPMQDRNDPFTQRHQKQTCVTIS
jgi:hypothetical protein